MQVWVGGAGGEFRNREEEKAWSQPVKGEALQGVRREGKERKRGSREGGEEAWGQAPRTRVGRGLGLPGPGSL